MQWTRTREAFRARSAARAAAKSPSRCASARCKRPKRAAAYARDEPMKSLLIAAAAGALLMGLLSLMVRSDD